MTRPVPYPKTPMPHWVRGAADAVVSALLAPTCAVCGRLLDQPTQGCVCDSCWRSVLPITPPICDTCGDPFARSTKSLIQNSQCVRAPTRCAHCSKSESSVKRARAVGEYEGTLREIIHVLKYAGRLSLAKPLAAQMRSRGADVLGAVDCVVPVPLHWRREHQRGFNQAYEIARHIGPPVVCALIRGRPTRPQVELAADRRKANVAGAFVGRRALFRKDDIRGKTVLLIDDVSTTGATLDACAHALHERGALVVYALTAARVVTRRARVKSPLPNP